MKLHMIRCALTLLFAAACVPADQAYAQDGMAGCKVDKAGPQEIWSCPGGLTIIVENGARFSLEDRDHDGNVDLVRLWRRALLVVFIESPGRDLHVTTPQAITAARGTKWAVDVGGGKTSVFVVTGAVSVRRPSVGSGVVLTRGEGVDVDHGRSQLRVKKWGAPRVAALMGRLGL
jgi:ferric-dicitrate binding protein FerR (iron transport regulator)